MLKRDPDLHSGVSLAGILLQRESLSQIGSGTTLLAGKGENPHTPVRGQLILAG